mmetsp:Transcript_16854/g.39951  ORF Transcript_16854/g.39951 Transcript_16854/m.39951 type:complete len:202 (-) Transcript_16854:3225-3830(-)
MFSSVLSPLQDNECSDNHAQHGDKTDSNTNDSSGVGSGRRGLDLGSKGWIAESGNNSAWPTVISCTRNNVIESRCCGILFGPCMPGIHFAILLLRGGFKLNRILLPRSDGRRCSNLSSVRKDDQAGRNSIDNHIGKARLKSISFRRRHTTGIGRHQQDLEMAGLGLLEGVGIRSGEGKLVALLRRDCMVGTVDVVDHAELP